MVPTGDTQDSGRLRVGETEDLREHERGAPVGVEGADEHIEIDLTDDRRHLRSTRLRRNRPRRRRRRWALRT